MIFNSLRITAPNSTHKVLVQSNWEVSGNVRSNLDINERNYFIGPINPESNRSFYGLGRSNLIQNLILLFYF